MVSYQQKYEPQILSDMIIHDPNNDIMPFLTKIAAGKIAQNIIFYGANGTGKTTLAKVLTSSYYASYNEEDTTFYIEMANQKDSKNYEPDRVLWSWSKSGIGWHIFDEVEKCSHKNVFHILHHTLDSKIGHKYILTTNSLSNIPQGLLSRAQPIPIDCPTPHEFLPRAKQILSSENVNATDEKILAVLSAVPRDMRRYYDVLERL